MVKGETNILCPESQKRQNQGETSTFPGKTKDQVKEDVGCYSVSRERVWHAMVLIVKSVKNGLLLFCSSM